MLLKVGREGNRFSWTIVWSNIAWLLYCRALDHNKESMWLIFQRDSEKKSYILQNSQLLLFSYSYFQQFLIHWNDHTHSKNNLDIAFFWNWFHNSTLLHTCTHCPIWGSFVILSYIVQYYKSWTSSNWYELIFCRY